MENTIVKHGGNQWLLVVSKQHGRFSCKKNKTVKLLFVRNANEW